jgi:hypothetical protein
MLLLSMMINPFLKVKPNTALLEYQLASQPVRLLFCFDDCTTLRADLPCNKQIEKVNF